MTNRLSRSLSYGLMVPAAFSLAACSGQATTAEQQPAPRVEIKRATVVSLFEAAFVGTPEKPGCLWGKAYDTELHIGEEDLVPKGFVPAIPRVSNDISSDTRANIYVTPRGNDGAWVGLEVSYQDGKIHFNAMGNGSIGNNSTDQLTTLVCKKSASVVYP